MERAHEDRATPPIPDSGRGPLVAASVICAVTLPLTAIMLVQVLPDALDTDAIVRILVLAVVLHAAGFLCPRWPRTAFALGAGAMLGLAFVSAPGTSSAALVPSAATFLLLEWQMASTQRRGIAIGALGVGVVGAGIVTVVDAVALGLAEPILIAFESIALVAIVTASWTLGVLARHRRIAAARRAEQRIRDAVAGERARIGRDLHDVVSHSLTVMIAQAEAARVLARDPESADALERVAETGRSAMQGLRRMLRVLDDPAGGPDLAPSPALGGLASLVADAGSLDHRTSYVVRGDPRPLRPDAELALVRATQEAITNAVRHVRPPVRIDVELAWGADEVVLSVVDDGGRGPSDDAVGTRAGLVGLTERVRQAGGTLDVQRDGGWTVRVAIPIEEDT